MEKFQNKYRIPSARAYWHDYNCGVYFVTICTKNREHYLGEITHCRDVARNVSTEPQMQLSPIGQYAYEQFMNVKSHYPYAEIPLFVIMPDHIHAIVTIDGKNEIDGNGVHTQCGNVVHNQCRDGVHTVSTGNRWKSDIVNNQNNTPFAWQTRFHDRIVRNQDEFDGISDYIEKNVVNWQNDI